MVGSSMRSRVLKLDCVDARMELCDCGGDLF